MQTKRKLMDYDEPLPLIERSEIIVFSDLSDEQDQNLTTSLAFYGYAILFSTWLLFLITFNSLFSVWSYVIQPLSYNPESKELHNRLSYIFESLDNYVLSFWCIYIVIWWWSIISWCGLKLFRHSKGIQS